ncbi:TonB-dependent receptor domain-containing protein [Pendulispora albinea]|uniref:Porin family protein n=1 Tax=Pendulispora albinea TaxID=2741071 RepID=A0ABZ2LVK4_9BACT
MNDFKIPTRRSAAPRQLADKALAARKRAGKRLAGLLAFLSMALVSGSALADARTEARRHFKAGMQLVQGHRYAEGIAELERANEILPHPNVVFNIARAHAEAGDLEPAIARYKEYIASDPPDQLEVELVLAQLEDRLAAQRVAETKPAPAPVPLPPKEGETPRGPQEIKPAEVQKPKAPAPGAESIVGEARTEDVYEETVVTASRGKQSPLDAPNSTTIVTRQDIRLSGITRIPELLRRVAGMDVMQITGGDTNVSMRGFNSRLANKLLVLVNGRSVYNDILGSTFWELLSIDVDQIERIEIIRGPGSALYGANAFAGVINIIPIAPGEGKSGFRVGYGDQQQGYGSVWASGREGDFAYRVSAGYTRYPKWSREVEGGRRDLVFAPANEFTASESQRLDIRTSRRWGKDISLEIGGGYANNKLDVYGIGAFNEYNFDAANGDVTVDLKTKHFNARTYFTRLAGTGQASHDYTSHSLYTSHPSQNVFNAEAEVVGGFGGTISHDIHFGLGYRLKDLNWDYFRPDVPVEHHASVFLQDSIRFGKQLTFVGSGRLDYVPYLKKIVPSPRASFIYKPTERQAFRLVGASAFRSPSGLESYIGLPIVLVTPGAGQYTGGGREDGSRLQPEQIVSAEIGYLNQMNDSFEFDITGYYERVTNLIALQTNRNVSLSDRGAGLGGYDPNLGRYTVAYGGFTNQCDTHNVAGGEIGARVYPRDGLDIFANYALNVSVQDKPSSCPIPDDERTSRHKINAGVQVRTKMGFNGELTWHYQSKQVWNEQVATLDGIVYKQFDVPGYMLLNGRLGYRFYHDKIEVSGTVYNLLGDALGDPLQMHPFGNRIGRRFMAFFTYTL